MNLKELHALAIEEATALRENLTQREVDNLNYENLSGSSVKKCLYGQATGNCYSGRALELILKCAPKVYKPNQSQEDLYAGGRLSDVYLNGAPEPLRYPEDRGEQYHTPLEILVFKEKLASYCESDDMYNLIRFLKREINTLTF